MASEADSVLDVLVFRETAGATAARTGSQSHFNQLFSLQAIYRDTGMCVDVSVTGIAQSDKFRVLVFPRIQAGDIMFMMDMEMMIGASLGSAPLTAVVVTSKNYKTLSEPFSSLKEERVRFLRLSKE